MRGDDVELPLKSISSMIQAIWILRFKNLWQFAERI